jgi:hypothetical protein
MSTALRKPAEPEAEILPAPDPVAAFKPALRVPLRRFAARHPACADLVISFPAAAVAIVTGTRGKARSQAAEAAVQDGLRRRDIAERLNLPYWMRRVPAANCDLAVPASLGFAPRTPAEAKLPRLLPEGAFRQRSWLQSVFHLASYQDDDIFAWALEMAPLDRHLGPDLIDLTLACRFYASRPELPGARGLPAGLAPQNGFLRLLNAAVLWIRQIVHEHLWRCQQAAFEAVPEAVFRGYRLRLVHRLEEIEEIAARYQNCLRSYAMMILNGTCYIYEAERPDGLRFLIDVRPDEGGGLMLNQAKWPGNGDVEAEDLRVIHDWMSSQAMRFVPDRLRRIYLQNVQNAMMSPVSEFFAAYPAARQAFCHPKSDILLVLQRPRLQHISRRAEESLLWLDESARAAGAGPQMGRTAVVRQLREVNDIISLLGEMAEE